MYQLTEINHSLFSILFIGLIIGFSIGFFAGIVVMGETCCSNSHEASFEVPRVPVQESQRIIGMIKF